MMPANRLRRKRNLLKIVKIDRNAEHLQFIMEMALILLAPKELLLKRRGGKLSSLCLLYQSYLIKCRECKVLMGNFLMAAALSSDRT